MLLSATLALAALAGRALGIPTISAKGSKFFKSDGSQFYIKGIAYQLSEDDPLADGDQCARDVELMKELGANALRIYHVVANQSHDDCMQTFSDAGIYTFIDLDTFDTYLYSDDGGGRWTESQMDAFSAVMDEFQQYDNVAGFFVANELLNFGAASVGAPYIKAAAVDMKNYRDSQGYRNIPIGYSAADIADLRPNLQNYMACGEPDEALDFYSLNAYEWCGDQTYETSGYEQLQQNASDYNIPIWFSEVGCNAVKPRTFGDQAAIFSDPMVDTWSGSMIYEWIQEQNDYGLVSYGPPADPTATGSAVIAGYTRAGTPTPVNPDFENLSSQWATLSPTGVMMSAYSPSLSPVACPDYTSGFWEVSGTQLPTVGAAYTGGPNTMSTGSPMASSSRGGGGSGSASSGSASGSAMSTASGSGASGASSTPDSTNTQSGSSTSTGDSSSDADSAASETDSDSNSNSNSDSDSDSDSTGGDSGAGVSYRVSAAAGLMAGLMGVVAFVL